MFAHSTLGAVINTDGTWPLQFAMKGSYPRLNVWTCSLTMRCQWQQSHPPKSHNLGPFEVSYSYLHHTQRLITQISSITTEQ